MSAGRIMRIMGSWWTTALLLSTLAGVYLALSFGRNPYPAWINFVFHSPWGIAVYTAVVVNITAASIRIIASRLHRPALSPGSIRSMDICVDIPLPGRAGVRQAVEWVNPGASDADMTTSGIRRISGSLSFLPGTLFRAGLITVLIALMVTAHTRKAFDTTIRQGERKNIAGSGVFLAELKADLPADYMQIGEEGTFLLNRVSGRVAYSGKSAVITPGFPARINDLWFRIAHLGYFQTFKATVHGMTREQTIDLDVLPPGRQDTALLPSGLVLTISLDPDRTIEKGLLKGRQYNLSDPVYRVGIQQGKKQSEEKRLGPGERTVLGPVRLALGQRGLYVRLQVIADPALPWLYGGVIIMLAGLFAMVSRFFWYEREVAALASNGRLLAGSRDEFFKKWGIARFQRWSGGLPR